MQQHHGPSAVRVRIKYIAPCANSPNVHRDPRDFRSSFAVGPSGRPVESMVSGLWRRQVELRSELSIGLLKVGVGSLSAGQIPCAHSTSMRNTMGTTPFSCTKPGS
jgi:hypothetical protein